MQAETADGNLWALWNEYFIQSPGRRYRTANRKYFRHRQ